MHLAIIVGITATFAPLAHATNSPCRPIVVLKEIELPAGELVLSDLLSTDVCPALLHAAGQIHLGSVPLVGSPRVFTGDEIRVLLEKLDDKEELDEKFLTVPERVMVRRKGGHKTDAAAHLAGPAVSRSVARSQVFHSNTASGALSDEVVRPGQTVMLLWDQDGIRLQIPALCLDRGVPGSEVRARILRGGTVVRATVVSADSLRAIS